MNHTQDKPVKPEWSWWDELRRTGELQPMYDGMIQFGYYRKPSAGKHAGARWVAIGVFPSKDGEVICEVNGKRTQDRPFDVMFSKGLQAITHELYMAVTRQGAKWPDEAPPLSPDPIPQPSTQQGDKYVVRIGDDGARTVSVPDDRKDWRIDENPATDFPESRRTVPAANRVVDAHHNEPPNEERILVDKRAQLDEEQLLVAKRLQTAIATQDEANSVSEHANRIALLGKWFEREYEERNRPLLEQQKVIRVDYLHPSQEANELARTLTQHTAAFLLAEQRRLEAEQRAAAEAEAARIQQAAEEAAAKGETITPEIVRPGAPTPPKRAGAGGLTGRRTTVSEEPIGIITDYIEFAGVLIRGSLANPPANYCSSPELKNVLDVLANKLAKKLPKDQMVSGLRIEKLPKARR